jgi:hypothetical protein
LSNEILQVADILSLQEVAVNDTFDKILSDADTIIDQAKDLIFGKTLDRHKIQAAISISILMNPPITLKHEKPQLKARFANEMVALNFCTRQLYHNRVKDFTARHPAVDENIISGIYPYFMFPDPARNRDETVLVTLLKALSFYKKYTESMKDKGIDLLDVVMGSILLISHIYFFIESHNWKLWHERFNSHLLPMDDS